MPFRKEMNMSTVEIETGTYIKRFAFWNPATWSIPKLYWDAWSQEQRLHAICRQLEKVIAYADYIGVNVDDIAARLKAIEEGQIDPIIIQAVEDWFAEHEEDITLKITALENALPIDEFDSENTVKDAIDAVSNVLPIEEFDSENTVKDAIDAVDAKFEDYSTTVEMNEAIENAVEPYVEYMNYPDHLFGAWPIIRDEYDYANYIPQGCCIYPSDTKQYVAVYLQKSGASTDGLLRVYDKTTKQRLSNQTVAYGHGSSIDYDDEAQKMFIIGPNENYYVYELDATDPVSPSLSRAYDFTALNLIPVCYYKENKFVALNNWTSKTRKLYLVDLATMEPEELCTVPIRFEQWPGLLQSYSYDPNRDVFTLSSSNAGSKAVFFKSDGTLIKTMGFEPQYSFIHLYESQEVSTIDNHIYFMTGMVGFDGVGVYKHMLTVFEGDLNDPSKSSLTDSTPLANWVLVNLSENNSLYNDFDDGNNYIGSTVHPIKLACSADLQAVFDVFPNNPIHIVIPEDYTNEVIMVPAGGHAVTIDGNNHEIAGAFLSNGQFSLRTMGANTTNYANWLTEQRGGLPCLFIAVQSSVMIQNIFNGEDYYACSAQCSKVFCRDSATAARVHNAGCSYTAYGVLA